MEWTCKDVFEFIELLKTEPCISEPMNKDRNNRTKLREAWRRIQKKFSVACSTEDLKRKRNSLLAQYRHIIRKHMRKGDESYTPTWFAFNALDEYLGHFYHDHESRKTIRANCTPARLMMPVRVTAESRASPESTISLPIKQEPSPEQPYTQTEDLAIELTTNDSTDPEGLSESAEASEQCDLYGQLLASKLKALREDDRLMLMNEIDNLVFKYVMVARQRGSSANT